MPAEKDQGEIGLEYVLRLLKMELHCNARRTGHKTVQFSSTFFCSVHVLGAFFYLTEILVSSYTLYFDFLRGGVETALCFFSLFKHFLKWSQDDRAFISWSSHISNIWEWFHPYEISSVTCLKNCLNCSAIGSLGKRQRMSESSDLKNSSLKKKGGGDACEENKENTKQCVCLSCWGLLF